MIKKTKKNIVTLTATIALSFLIFSNTRKMKNDLVLQDAIKKTNSNRLICQLYPYKQSSFGLLFYNNNVLTYKLKNNKQENVNLRVHEYGDLTRLPQSLGQVLKKKDIKGKQGEITDIILQQGQGISLVNENEQIVSVGIVGIN